MFTSSVTRIRCEFVSRLHRAIPKHGCTMSVGKDLHGPYIPNIFIILLCSRPRRTAWRLTAGLPAGHAEDFCKSATEGCLQEYSHRWQTCADNARRNFNNGSHVSLFVEPCGVILAQDKHWVEKAGHSFSAITEREWCISKVWILALICILGLEKRIYTYKRPNAKIRDRAIFCGFGSWIFHTQGIGIDQPAKSLIIFTIA